MICVIEKATNLVKDVGQRYDERFFDHVTVPDGAIPADVDPRKYFRNGLGNIVLRPSVELEATFSNEWKVRVTARIDASLLPDGVKTILKELVARL